MKRLLLIIAFFTGIACNASAQSAYIDNTWIEHNVFNAGYNCMCVHIELTVEDWEGRSINASAYVFDYYGNKVMAPYGAPAMFRSRDGQLCSGANSRVQYESTHWDDIRLFIPYSLLPPGDYQCAVQIATTSGTQLAYSDPEYFTVGR